MFDDMKSFQELFNAARSTNAYWQSGVLLEFTEAICKRLDELKISKTEFAKRLGVSKPYVTKILRGGENFSLKTMFKMCEVLNLKMHLRVTTKL